MTSAPSTTSTPPSNFEALFDAALAKYSKRTGQDLRNHPLTAIIDRCQSPDAILEIFQEKSRAFDEFRNDDSDPKLITWLTPVVNGLHAISNCAVLSAGISLVFPPAQVIFSGIGVLLSTAKYVRESYDVLADIFDPRPPETIIKIMVELLAVLALATRQINRGRLKRFAKKLLGEEDIGQVLQRLDRLTLEESKVAIAQTLDVVHSLVNNMEVVMDDGKASTSDIRQSLVMMQKLVMKVNQMERDQLQENVRRWLSAPDPWSNHNVARKAHHRGTAMWFTQGDIFGKWKITGCLLWIHGLPGSGKTVLSSSIIEEIQDMRQMGLATISFFYFDFRDGNKQDVRHLLSSLLIQLCDQSDKFCETLSTLFIDHRRGSRQPSEEALMECLESMLKLRGQGPHYLVLDALDECPDSSGCPTAREQVLAIVQHLIDLQLPYVHFCITSRSQIDIQEVLQPLAIYNVPLHEQAGQNQDIVDYVNDFVRSDPRMRRWQEEDKQLVIETLTEKAHGMFRWVHCQIETLRRCFQPSIRRILGELPETLDETYERILLEIDKEKQAYAHQLFQYLVICIRPLRVNELAELFATPPNSDLTPGFNIGWRPEDPETFILSACSTLVAIVNVVGEKVVQFSHSSVREYLTSDRVANSAPVSHFHILLQPAHTLLARACLSALFQLNYSVSKTMIQSFPLASYAAEHWMDHARFETVSSGIRHEMDHLFDRNQPYLAAWVWLYDIELSWRRRELSPHPTRPDAVPLYYAALCGFHDLAKRLLNAHPQDVNAQGGYHETPLFAALKREHLDIVLFLLERGADVEFRGRKSQTALYLASSCGYAEVVRSLIDRGANPNAVCDDKDDAYSDMKWTPLLIASKNGRLEIARMLLEKGADVNYRDNFGRGSLHFALHDPSNDLARLLLDHGANHNASTILGETALHCAASKGQIMVVMLLLEYNENVDARSNSGRTPLHEAAEWGHQEVVQALLHQGADANAQTKYRRTPMHLAAINGHLRIVEILLKCGADPHAQTDEGETPFEWASGHHSTEIMRLLLEHAGERMED